MARINGLLSITTNPTGPRALDFHSALPTAVIGQAYAGAIWVDGGSGGYILSVTSKPAWLTATLIFGFGWNFTGTPSSLADAGEIVVSCTDSSSTTTSRRYRVEVRSAIQRSGGSWLTSGTTPPPAYTGNVAYLYDVTKLTVSPTLPFVSASLGGSLPTGMSLATSGANTGQVSASNVTGATSSVVITLTDTAGAVWAVPLRFEVKPGLSASISAPSAVVGLPYKGKLTVAGGSGQVSILALPANPLPTGLQIHAKTGDITGNAAAITPTGGATPTHFQVTDLVTGQQIVTTLIGGGSKNFVVGSVAAPAARGRFTTFDNTGALTSIDLFSGWFGSGIDGAFVLDGTNTYSTVFSKLGAVYTQLRPIYATSITVSAGSTLIQTADIFCSVNADVSAAGCRWHSDGQNASGVTHGNSATGNNYGPLAGRGVSGNGGTSTPTGSVPGGAATPASNDGGIGVSGNGGASGAGSGGGSAGTGGAPQATIYTTGAPFPLSTPFAQLEGFFGWYNGGLAAGGGAAGGGNGTLAGGNGGGAGGAPGIIKLFAYTLTTSASTSAGTFSAKGGNAANGVNAPGAGRGAGGGGGGPSGGIVWIVCVFRDGTPVANLINVSGGNAGTAGATGSGNAGVNGTAGTSGFAFCFVLSTQTSFVRDITAPSGTTGGVGTLTF